MKKSIIVCLFLFLFIFPAIATAEPYKSSKVPSDEIIRKRITKTRGGKIVMVGKLKIRDSVYKVYYLYTNSRGSQKLSDCSIAGLDSGLWIYDNYIIIEK